MSGISEEKHWTWGSWLCSTFTQCQSPTVAYTPTPFTLSSLISGLLPLHSLRLWLCCVSPWPAPRWGKLLSLRLVVPGPHCAPPCTLVGLPGIVVSLDWPCLSNKTPDISRVRTMASFLDIWALSVVIHLARVVVVREEPGVCLAFI